MARRSDCLLLCASDCNGVYQKAGELTNPRKCTEDTAAALKIAGSSSIAGFDLDKCAIGKAIPEFEVVLQGAQKRKGKHRV